MKKIEAIISFFLVLVLFLNTEKVQGQENLITLENQSMYSDILKQDVKYSVCLPEEYYQSDKSYPVVYMFHGLGDNASSWLEYGRIDVFSKHQVRGGTIIPMIYIMPEGYTNYYVNDFYGKFMYQDMLIKELIPFVDKKFRTLADKDHRATLGYSMGGFGALTVALNNQDVFSVTVPLSISIRTDQQYMEEDIEGWDEQWGRLFGGINEVGEKRITDYYKENSPFYMLKNKPVSTKIFISSGDDEATLAYSNEELHMLMRDQNIRHEFRVYNGGHEFAYWFDALSYGLNFVSDAFTDKPYRGDDLIEISQRNGVKLISDKINKTDIEVYLPDGYEIGNRLYPVLYVDAKLDRKDKVKLAQIVDNLTLTMQITPMIVIFLESKKGGLSTDEIITYCQSRYRIRDGRRFRAYLGYKDGGISALNLSTSQQFTCIASFDASISENDKLLQMLNKSEKDSFRRTSIYIDAPDKGLYYRGNGSLHLLLKDKKVSHEYRVRQGSGETDYLIQGLDEVLKFISNKIHI